MGIRLFGKGGNHTTEKYVELLYGSIPGLTGHLLIMCCCLMGITSVEWIRKRKYEAFWYTHHFFWVFFTLLFIHGTYTQKKCTRLSLFYFRKFRNCRGSAGRLLSGAVARPLRFRKIQQILANAIPFHMVSFFSPKNSLRPVFPSPK